MLVERFVFVLTVINEDYYYSKVSFITAAKNKKVSNKNIYDLTA